MDIPSIRRNQLRKLVDKHESKADFARHYGVDPTYVSQLLNGHCSFGEKSARNLEKKLGIQDGWLDIGSDKDIDINVQLEGIPTYQIPLISWVRAGLFCSSPDLLQPGDAEQMLPVFKKYGPHAYALRVVGDSMVSPHAGQKSYLPGQIIYVDPDRVVNNGSKVIARIDGSDEATFKVYVEDGGKKYLKPLNPQYPIIEMDETMHICGVVVGGTWDE